MTAQILEQERLFSRMDHETGLMQSGRLQLVRGTLLILDFTQYKTAAKATKENYGKKDRKYPLNLKKN
jgi:hypothetical protein